MIARDRHDAGRAYWRALARAGLGALLLGVWLALAWAAGPVIAERVAYLLGAFS